MVVQYIRDARIDTDRQNCFGFFLVFTISTNSCVLDADKTDPRLVVNGSYR
jgi:hypothetical protein